MQQLFEKIDVNNLPSYINTIGIYQKNLKQESYEWLQSLTGKKKKKKLMGSTIKQKQILVNEI